MRRFNALGRVPTNRTTLQIIRNDSEHRWQSAESIALLAAIAGLFHDFGKAGMCFQQTLKGESQHLCQPYRHEWISVRLFEAFVGKQTDEQWLTSLTQLKAADEKAMLKALKMDTDKNCSLLEKLPPLAKVVVWLMLSHHRLSMADGVEPWVAIDYAEVLQALAETKQMELDAVSRRYGEMTLRVSREEETEQWLYHPVLGVFRAL